jgi:SRSO17 transposase
VRVRVADGPPQRIRDMSGQHMPGDEAWLIGERRATGEHKYYLSNLPTDTTITVLASTIKARWICEQAHQQLKEELGLDHFEGRSWHGLHQTLHEKPVTGTHWSIRKMARATDLSYTSVQRIWKAHELKPHLVKTFKLSNDKRFVEKVQDIVGLYLDPPDKTLVFSVDEKSQIQALDRTQPGLPIKKAAAAP